MTALEDATSMFYSCERLGEIHMANMPSLKKTFRMFYECNSLSSADVTGTTSIEDAEGMFQGCTSLKEVKGVSGLASLTNAYEMFRDCTSLASAPDLSKMVNLEETSNMFYSCSSLIEWTQSSVFSKFGAGMFTATPTPIGCPNLTKDEIINMNDLYSELHSKFSTSHDHYIYKITYDPNGGQSGTIKSQFVEGNTSSITVTIPYEATPTTTLNYEFDKWVVYKSDSESYKPGDKITISQNKLLRALWRTPIEVTFTVNGLTYNGDSRNGVKITEYNSAIAGSNVTIPAEVDYENKTYSVVGIDTLGGRASPFAGDSLIHVDFEKNEKITDLRNAFLKAYSLRTANLSKLPNLEKVSRLFSNCSGMTYPPDLSKLSKISDTSGMFFGCKSLKTAPNLSRLGNISNAYSMFRGCISLRTAPDLSKLKKLNEPNTTNYMFDGCTSLNSWGQSTLFTNFGKDMFNDTLTPIYCQSLAGSSISKMNDKYGSRKFARKYYRTITFDPNGGKLGKIEVAHFESESSVVSAKIPTSATATRDSYNFKGWALDSDASISQYRPGDEISLASDITLYAVWKKIISYTVIYDPNGGYSGEIDSQTVEGEGPTLCLYISKSSIPYRYEHEFRGWSDDKSAISSTWRIGDRVDLDENMRLYAVWKKIETPDPEPKPDPGPTPDIGDSQGALVVYLPKDKGEAVYPIRFDFDIITSIEARYSAKLESIQTIMFGVDNKFIMDLGVTENIQATIVRINPDDYDDSSTNPRKWSNAKWIDSLFNALDHWQNLSYTKEGGLIGGCRFIYNSKSCDDKTNIPCVDRNVFVSGAINQNFDSMLQKANFTLIMSAGEMSQDEDLTDYDATLRYLTPSEVNSTPLPDVPYRTVPTYKEALTRTWTDAIARSHGVKCESVSEKGEIADLLSLSMWKYAPDRSELSTTPNQVLPGSLIEFSKFSRYYLEPVFDQPDMVFIFDSVDNSAESSGESKGYAGTIVINKEDEWETMEICAVGAGGGGGGGVEERILLSSGSTSPRHYGGAGGGGGDVVSVRRFVSAGDTIKVYLGIGGTGGKNKRQETSVNVEYIYGYSGASGTSTVVECNGVPTCVSKGGSGGIGGIAPLDSYLPVTRYYDSASKMSSGVLHRYNKNNQYTTPFRDYGGGEGGGSLGYKGGGLNFYVPFRDLVNEKVVNGT